MDINKSLITGDEMSELTKAIVRELIDYNPDSGVLRWRKRARRWFTSTNACNSWNAKNSGKTAFTTIRNGYLSGAIFHKPYFAHRVIWLWMTGRWPDSQTDHENHDRTDNRWCNLYKATNQENGRNQSLRCDITSGHTGVRKIPNGTFQARIKVDDQEHHLGCYPTLDAAVAARQAAERRYDFHPRHGERHKQWQEPFVSDHW
jgi:hypothetical protein